MPLLNDNEKKQYAMFKQLLDSAEASIAFVKNLKQQDVRGKGYLNENMIIAAFNNTYKDFQNNVSRIPKPNDQ